MSQGSSYNGGGYGSSYYPSYTSSPSPSSYNTGYSVNDYAPRTSTAARSSLDYGGDYGGGYGGYGGGSPISINFGGVGNINPYGGGAYNPYGMGGAYNPYGGGAYNPYGGGAYNPYGRNTRFQNPLGMMSWADNRLAYAPQGRQQSQYNPWSPYSQNFGNMYSSLNQLLQRYPDRTRDYLNAIFGTSGQVDPVLPRGASRPGPGGMARSGERIERTPEMLEKRQQNRLQRMLGVGPGERRAMRAGDAPGGAELPDSIENIAEQAAAATAPIVTPVVDPVVPGVDMGAFGAVPEVGMGGARRRAPGPGGPGGPRRNRPLPPPPTPRLKPGRNRRI